MAMLPMTGTFALLFCVFPPSLLLLLVDYLNCVELRMKILT